MNHFTQFMRQYAIPLIGSLLLASSLETHAQQPDTAAANPLTDSVANAQTAIIHELSGSASLLKQGAPQRPLQLNQRLLDGNILDIKKDSMVEITYNNGCSEVISSPMPHTVDACKCLTSPFRKGIRDMFNATLKDIAGEVLVFQGEKYVPAKENMRLRNGDRLMTMSDGSATISYDHGCQQDVSSFTVHDVDGCSPDCPLVELAERVTDQPVPASVPRPPVPLPPGPVPAALPPVPLPPVPVPPVPAPIPGVNPGIIGTVVGPVIIPVIDDDNDTERAVSP